MTVGGQRLRSATFGLLSLVNRPWLLLAFNLLAVGVTWLCLQFLVGGAVALGLMAWLFLHEIGHLVVMAGLRLKPVLLVIPIGGAFSIPKRPFRSELQSASTTLSGVLFGTVALVLASILSGRIGEWAELIEYIGFLNLVNLTPLPMTDGIRLYSNLRASTSGLLRLGLTVGFPLVSMLIILLVSGISMNSLALAVPFAWKAMRPGAAPDPSTDRVPLSGAATAAVCLVCMACLAASAMTV